MYEENVYEAKVMMNGKNICISNLVIGKRYGADILLNMFEEKEND